MKPILRVTPIRQNKIIVERVYISSINKTIYVNNRSKGHVSQFVMTRKNG